MSKARKFPLGLGEAAPWFNAPTLEGSPSYTFDTAAGRPILLLFFGTASNPEVQGALAALQAKRDLFDDKRAAFFGVTIDPADAEQKRIQRQLPGIRYFLDYDRNVSRIFGAIEPEPSQAYLGHWLLLDRTLRVRGRFPLTDGEAALEATARLAATPPVPDWAPVVAVPDVLEPQLCRKLIDLYEADGGEESGFMRDVDGMTKLMVDSRHKVRRDYLVEEPALARQLNLRIMHRLLPMVKRAFQYEATRVERLLVGCYEAETGGHFRAHRDDTSKGTAHRRFAVTINLNAGDYEGGDLLFPEYGPRTYRAPTGGAIVFSCSLLHQAMPVTKGRRFAFLPFLYDDAGAKL
ncbi:MAG TPA: redoxin domain-containing protein, partial [Allosphingosinicella sp.]|nr:redoxin domain-containing protein [Allosphingosinicella sp.]